MAAVRTGGRQITSDRRHGLPGVCAIPLGLCALAVVLATPVGAQTAAQFDAPFGQPQYLIHATGHGTTSGGVKDDSYLLYTQAPDAMGRFLLPDGSGGTFGYSSDFHAGPLPTPRSVCQAAAARGLPARSWTAYNHNDSFDCRMLAAGAATGSGPTATAPSSPGAQNAPPESHTFRNTAIAIGVIGVLLLLGAGAAVWWAAGSTEVVAGGAAIEGAEGAGLLAAATVPEGLTWGSLIGNTAEAERLVQIAYDGARLSRLTTQEYQLANALRTLREGGKLSAAAYELLRRLGYLP